MSVHVREHWHMLKPMEKNSPRIASMFAHENKTCIMSVW